LSWNKHLARPDAFSFFPDARTLNSLDGQPARKAANYSKEMTAHLKRIVVGIVGGLVLFVGIAMIILPGPAFLVIPTGLAILATQFEWAKRWRDKMRDFIRRKRKKSSGQPIEK
jgi:tellurite resistance protein TerC